LTAEGCLSVESQHGVENANEALILLNDEIQQRSNRVSTRTRQKSNISTKLVSRLKELNYK
jgi:hypothetical protein